MSKQSEKQSLDNTTASQRPYTPSIHAPNNDECLYLRCDDKIARTVLRSDLSDAHCIAMWLEIFTCRNLEQMERNPAQIKPELSAVNRPIVSD